MSDAGVEAVLQKLSRRIWLRNVLRSFSAAWLVSSVVLLLLAAARHIVVILHLFNKAAMILAFLWLAVMVRELAGRPGIRQAALAGDRLGLQDRLCTYLEYRGRHGAVLDAFREELAEALAGCNPARLLPVQLHRQQVLAAVIACAVAGCVFWLPSPRVRETALREAVNSELRQEAEKVALMRNALPEQTEKNEDPAGSTEANPAALLAELEKELARGFDYREAALQVDSTRQELERRARQPAPAEIKGLAGVFTGTGAKTSVAAGLLRSGDSAGAARALENAHFDEAERLAMLQNIRRLLGEAGPAGNRKHMLQNIKSALEREDFNAQELSEVLHSVAGPKDAAELAAAETKLRSMQERLLIKSGSDPAHPGDQEAGGELLAAEDAAVADSGEITNREAFLTAQGDAGNQARREVGALGGGAASGGGSGETGRVERSDTPVLVPGGGSEVLEVDGAWQENSGQISARLSDRVLGLAGDSGGYAALYREFQREGPAYLERFEIPPGQRQLVSEYFNRLREAD